MKKTALVLAVIFAFSGFTAVAKETKEGKKMTVAKLEKQVKAYKDVIIERNKKIEELEKKIAELEAKLAGTQTEAK